MEKQNWVSLSAIPTLLWQAFLALVSILHIGFIYNKPGSDLTPVENVKETKEESKQGPRLAGWKIKAEEGYGRQRQYRTRGRKCQPKWSCTGQYTATIHTSMCCASITVKQQCEQDYYYYYHYCDYRTCSFGSLWFHLLVINLPSSHKFLRNTWHLIHCHLMVLCYSGFPRRQAFHTRMLIKKAKADNLTKPVRIKTVADKGIELTTKTFWTTRESE